ncbi:hypothetical protein B296_00033625, partial [Ensete ventricosum]
IESIELLEAFRGVERKAIILVDSDGAKLKFVLWGEQILLANLFRYIVTTKTGNWPLSIHLRLDLFNDYWKVVEQAMYLCTLRTERFIVAIVNCKRSINRSSMNLEEDPVVEVVRAQKCE